MGAFISAFIWGRNEGEKWMLTRCDCGHFMYYSVSRSEANPFRRYIRCRRFNQADGCKIFRFVDPQLPEDSKRAASQMIAEYKILKREKPRTISADSMAESDYSSLGNYNMEIEPRPQNCLIVLRWIAFGIVLGLGLMLINNGV